MDLTTSWDCFPRHLNCWAGSLWASGPLVKFLRRAGAQRHPVEGPAGAQGEGSRRNLMRAFPPRPSAPGPWATSDWRSHLRGDLQEEVASQVGCRVRLSPLPGGRTGVARGPGRHTGVSGPCQGDLSIGRTFQAEFSLLLGRIFYCVAQRRCPAQSSGSLLSGEALEGLSPVLAIC